MSRRSKLRRYAEKRNLRQTSEPKGGKRKSSRRPRFVIQMHDARSLHFDLRLEVDGVFKSWAVPKGPSTDPRQKRLALPVEDHPLEYGDFEGVIPGGQYGAGTVLVWDRGTYRNTTRHDGRRLDMTDGLQRGHVAVRLHGRKLRGAYALTRTGAGRHPRWLLVKLKDEEADARRRPARTQRRSVLSGDTLAGIRRRAARDRA